MFTDRYIKLPIELVNNKQAELIGDDDPQGFPSFIMLNPFEIAYYRPCIDKEGEKELDATLIVMKGGESIVIELSVDDFEIQLNHFVK